MEPEIDYYKTLGLGRRCTAEEIRNAFRLLARLHHPDLHPDDPDALEKSQAINAANDVLGNPAKRIAYDRELAAREHPQAAPPRARARALKQDVYLRVEDFLRGTTLDVTVNDPANPGGRERYPLEVPADTAPGERFKIARDAPFDGEFVEVRVRARPGARFTVRGSDLKTEVRISNERAARGGNESVPGATGRSVSVAIPAGVARGTVVRVPGEGLPKPRGGRGDLLVRVTYRPEVRVTRR